jgi:hypothetical protein
MKRLEGRWTPEESCAANARRELPRFAAAYFRAGRKAARKRSSASDLHEFRLATKHFRYLLELFQPLYADRLEASLKQLRHVQTLLGELNDYETTRELLDGDSSQPEVLQLNEYLEAKRAAKRREFRKYWIEVFDAEGEALRWRELLSHLVRRPVLETGEPRKPAETAAKRRFDSRRARMLS